ncbi:MAG: HD domain-containing protein [Gammaproteobacteria bacterium]|nr:HD domain-containing protein [Gammaproteobacteria bacterium]
MSIKQVIVFTILGLLFVTVFVTQYYTYFSTQKVLIQHAYDMMGGAARDTIERSVRFLEPAQDAAKLTQRLANHNVVSSDKSESLERYFYEQLNQNSSFSGIYYGTIDGGFVYVKRDDSIQKSGFKTKLIKYSDGQRVVTSIWRDQHFNRLKSLRDNEDSYDPRSRPWYTKAVNLGKLVWTEPYIFYSSKQPGITTSSPVYKSNQVSVLTGVVGVDIEISELSIFLANLKIGKSGSAFIINQNSEVVAYPDLEKIKQDSGDGSGTIQFSRVNEIDNRVAYEAYNSLIDQGYTLDIKQQVSSRFVVDDVEYQGVFTPFNHSQWPWVIIIYGPTDDFIGVFKSNLQNNLYISIFIALFAGFIGYFIAKRIIRPIRELGENAEKLMIGDYSDVGEIDTHFSEIKTTTIAFSRMARNLQEKDDRNRELTANLREANLTTIIRLSDAAEFKDGDTAAHILRMSSVAVAIARELKLDDEFCENMRHAAPMHDIGKIGVPDEILMKPGKLTAGEWVIIKTHPEIGADILRNPETEMLSMARSIALTHHEKWNGTGYPKELKGEEIPLEGRICAVADVVDALLSRRCYKDPLDIGEVLKIVREESGEHFDPRCVDAFFKAQKWVKQIYSKLNYHSFMQVK